MKVVGDGPQQTYDCPEELSCKMNRKEEQVASTCLGDLWDERQDGGLSLEESTNLAPSVPHTLEGLL